MGLLPLLRSAPRDLNVIVEVGGGPKGSPTASESANRIVPQLAKEGFHVYQIENTHDPLANRVGRVIDPSAINGECDLIFSRHDALAAVFSRAPDLP